MSVVAKEQAVATLSKEQNIIGTLLNNPEKIQIALEEELEPIHFTQHGEIFESMKNAAVNGRHEDVTSIAEKFGNNAQLTDWMMQNFNRDDSAFRHSIRNMIYREEKKMLNNKLLEVSPVLLRDTSDDNEENYNAVVLELSNVINKRRENKKLTEDPDKTG